MLDQPQLSIPFNGDLELLTGLPAGVGECYGRLTEDGFLGGRASYALRRIDRRMLREAVRQCKMHGIHFAYLLNSPYMGRGQFGQPAMRKLGKLLEWLCSIGVSGITVSLPQITLFSKKHYPELSVTASKFARVNSPARARMWQEHGVDKICVDGNLTRKPNAIRRVRAAFDGRLVILVNDACVEDCPWENCHAIYESVWSREEPGDYVSYFSTWCRLRMVRDKMAMLHSTFVRPEDLPLYRSWGIDQFKLVDRNRGTSWLRRAVEAYASGAYRGNLAELISLLSPHDGRRQGGKTVTRGLQRDSLDCRVVIKNERLDGFMESLAAKGCEDRADCMECAFCRQVADRAIDLSGSEAFLRKARCLLENTL